MFLPQATQGFERCNRDELTEGLKEAEGWAGGCRRSLGVRRFFSWEEKDRHVS
jgi:hypothetical protein